MEVTYPYVFQTDSEVVNEVYANHNNYLIEYNPGATENYCVLYFASNDLYYPNNEIAFHEQLVKKNRFEWYGNRIKYAKKHIFIRDIKKQWYLTGINATIDTPDKLTEFIRRETEGYKVIALGSSAGGFASILHGQRINAERIYSFNGQFEVLSQLRRSTADIDPIIFRNRDNQALLPYFNTVNFITNPASIFYFHSNKSAWDLEQWDHAKNSGVDKISFSTSNHGVPFLKTNLPVVINMSLEELRSLRGKTLHPILFSLKTIGFVKTVEGLKSIVQFGLNKLYIGTLLKLKNKIKKA